MRKIKILLSIFSLSLILLMGCSTETMDKPTTEESENMPMDNKEEMVHDESGKIPQGLQKAENPTYKVGDTVEILTDHMEGMKGAQATIVGAFDTIAYEVSYDPKNGGPREGNHKWVVQEEIKDAGNEMIENGTEVTIEASHMQGMEGAKATIESAEDTTVYMVDYEPSTGGEKIKNHKWVTDSEVSSE